jgi:drug/metabolite transporter (DMT)-like permease
MPLIYAIGVAIAAQAFIYTGLVFMAGKLLPNLLEPIYHLMPTASYRVVFSTFTVMLIGNYLFQRLYSLQPILIAGIISTVTGILIVNTGGLIIERKPPNILMTIGVIVLLTGAAVCVYARSRL